VLSDVCDTLDMPAASIRARVRAEMIEEIKAVARRHLASDGANLSLRAVARDMGMVSSAVYRYFASRDDLLTALIIDAYNALGAAAERADASVTDRADARARWYATGRGLRRWALAHPAEYALLFGSPVPGYQAPADTVLAAQRTPLVLLRICAQAARPVAALHVPPAVARDVTAVMAALADQLPTDSVDPAQPTIGSFAWIHLFGALSFELFGQLNNVIEARDEYFDAQLGWLADQLGL
jgi:AcrR family transcriptional regulator